MFKEKLKSFFKSKKINVFALFLGLSISFLMLTKFSKEYTQTIDFTIEKSNIPQEEIVVNDSLSNSIQITLKTYGFKLLAYWLSKPKVNIDFSELPKNKTHYTWLAQKQHSAIVNQFSANVEIKAINPDTLKFLYDRSFSKKVPIVFNDDIQYAIGFDLQNTVKLVPDSVKIIGPKIILDTITQVKTEALKLKNVNTSFTQTVNIALPKNKQLKFSDYKTQVSATVEKFTEGQVEVPVSVLNVPKNVSISFYPKTVNVFYYTSLKLFKTISASDFKVECDYNDIKEESQYLIPKVVLKPRTVKNVRLNTNKIEYILKTKS